MYDIYVINVLFFSIFLVISSFYVIDYVYIDVYMSFTWALKTELYNSSSNLNFSFPSSLEG